MSIRQELDDAERSATSASFSKELNVATRSWPQSRFHIGISGWRYPPWRGVFYPQQLPQRRELEYASRQVNSVEINGTFYSLQRPESFRTWKDATPDGFVFSVKGSRYITHLKRLKDIETPLANFFASGVLLLDEKLGPFLWQFPPQFSFDRARFATFFELLPRDLSSARKLARGHDERVLGSNRIPGSRNRPLRHAVEVRHPSFACEEFVELLREFEMALVIADTAGKWPFLEDVTSDFVYVRLHGDEELYVSGYTDAALEQWARKVVRWAAGGSPRGAHLHAARADRRPRDVFVYFDNDVKVHAPYDAMRLAQRVGGGVAPSMKRPLPVDEVTRRGWPAVRRRLDL